MDTKTVTVKQLFAPERRFLVPIFQRGYVWTRVGQWEPLWRDVVDQALIVRGELARQTRHVRRHFLGAIVLGEDQNRLLHVSSSSVIDGQQRLTTLQVLLAALRDAVAPLEDRNLSRQLLRLTDNEGDWADPDERFKLWPTNAYREDFRRVLTAGSPAALAGAYPQRLYRRKLTPARPPLVDAYLYFASAIGAYLRGSDEWNVPAPADAPAEAGRALELLEAVQSYLQLVTIELGAEDDPQVIFETLNARGVDLKPSDLVRNFVFLYAADHDEDPEALYDRYWKPFDDTPTYPGGTQRWWREKERQGRLFRERLDLFCFHYVTYRLNREIKIGHLFQEFRDWWERGDAVVDDEHQAPAPPRPPARVAAAELARMARAWRDFRALLAPDRGTRFGVFASRIKRLDTTTVYPLALWLAEHQDDVQPAEFAAILADVESYLVRRAVCGLTNKNYNQVFLGLLRRLRRQGCPSHPALRAELAALRGDSSVWPDDARFTQALGLRPIYTELGPVKTQMVLEALDEASDDGRAERVVQSFLTVEHVLPQAADPALWPYPPVPETADLDGEGEHPWAGVRSILLHTIGNLTLLTQRLNSSMGRDPFAVKRRGITTTSRLALNAYFQTMTDADPWDERAIAARYRVLAGLACRVWPHPGVTPGNETAGRHVSDDVLATLGRSEALPR